MPCCNKTLYLCLYMFIVLILLLFFHNKWLIFSLVIFQCSYQYLVQRTFLSIFYYDLPLFYWVAHCSIGNFNLFYTVRFKFIYPQITDSASRKVFPIVVIWDTVMWQCMIWYVQLEQPPYTSSVLPWTPIDKVNLNHNPHCLVDMFISHNNRSPFNCNVPI